MQQACGVVVREVRRVEEGRGLAEGNPDGEQYASEDPRQREPEDKAVDHGGLRAAEGDGSFLDSYGDLLDGYLGGPEDVRKHYDRERDRPGQSRVAPVEVDDERQEADVTQDD